MVRIAIQVRELISSNISSALDGATNPAKMLAQLQREIEEALIGLHGDFVRTRRLKERMEAAIGAAKAQESDWADRAKIAMDHGREDLARQALMARENCRETVARGKKDIASFETELEEIAEAERQLEAKREEVRQRHADELAVRSSAMASAARSQDKSGRTEQRLDKIEKLEKRTLFAIDENAAAASEARINREIHELERESAIEEELAALRKDASTAKKPAKKGPKRTRAA